MAGRTKEAEIYVARSSGVIKINGKIYRYLARITKVPRNHPLVIAMPDRFAPLALDYAPEA